MRISLVVPDWLLPTLQEEARAAHRPPKYHLEWIIRQVLEKHRETPPAVAVPCVRAEPVEDTGP